ncbi:MAG: response regulator [Pseudanabaenales cyanobacterium]|nr:response regulator [Pseudanabaenales cyanobacterium]
MIIPEAFSSTESRTVAHKAFVRLTDLIGQLQSCSQEQFTGELTVKLQATQGRRWSLYFYAGGLIGGTSEVHSIRRWCRQLSQHCPHLSVSSTYQGADRPQYWDYQSLAKLVEQGKIRQSQLTAVVGGNLTEILFDLIQAEQQSRYLSGLQLTFRQMSQDILDSALVGIRPEWVFNQAMQVWDVWLQAGLGSYSPNLAPVILDAEALRRQTSPLAYQNLTALVDGDRTLRDLAAKLQQNLVPLAQSLIPYIHTEVMSLVEVGDFTCELKSVAATPSIRPIQTNPSSPLVAYIEDSRFDSLKMSQILAQTGYRFTNVQDPVQALPVLLEQKPSLIFLDLLMPITNGYEICAQIRRVSAFQRIPVIIVTSSDGIVDRVRAKLVGASGFIAKPIDSPKVLNALQQHLPTLYAVRSGEQQASSPHLGVVAT